MSSVGYHSRQAGVVEIALLYHSRDPSFCPHSSCLCLLGSWKPQSPVHPVRTPRLHALLSWKDWSLGFGESPGLILGTTGLSGSVHSLRKEVARFLTFYCKTPEFLDPENVSLFPVFLTPWWRTIFLGTSAFPEEPLRVRAEWRPGGPRWGDSLCLSAQQGGRWGTNPSYTRIGFQLLASVYLLQVVILNGCSAVFSALAMVLCDPGGKSAGSARPQGHSPMWAGVHGPWALRE